MAQRICVTGASGLAGRAVVRELAEHAYDVAATDIVVHDYEMLRADLTDYGQAVEVLRGADAVVHLANIPAPGLATPPVTFNANITMNFNVFQAATALKLSVYTVDAHRGRIMEKLNLHSVGELVRFAVRNGLVD